MTILFKSQGERQFLAWSCRVALILLVAVATSARAEVYNIQNPQANYGNVLQANIPNGGQYMCGPTAAINSFVFLEKTYPAVYGRSLVPDTIPDGLYGLGELTSAAQAVAAAGYMDTQANLPGGFAGGTWDDWFIYGKSQYINTMAPGTTVYSAQMESTWGWQDELNPRVTPPAGKPNWVNDKMIPTWQFIYNELRDGEDLEMLITDGNWGHYLTVTGFSWNDADGDKTVDANEGATIFYIDPAGNATNSPISQQALGGQLFVSYPNFNNASLVMIVSESVPEPATLSFLSLAGMAMIRRRRWV